MVDTILYDWDGCLVQTLQMWLDINLKHFAKLGVQVTEQEIIMINHNDLPDELSRLGIEDPEGYVVELVRQGEERIIDVPFHKGAVETLKKLKENDFTLAIVSSQRRNIIKAKMDKTGIGELFTTIVASEDVTTRKPSPEGVHLALSKLGKSPSSAMIVGDGDHDLLAGKEAGIQTCLFMPETNLKFYDHKKFLALGPDLVIHQHKELLSVILDR